MAMRIIDRVRARRKRRAHERRVAAIDAILAGPGSPDTAGAEAAFETLRAAYPSRPEYGYDRVSVVQRAAERVAAVLGRLPRSERALDCLDVAAGDGVFGVLLDAAGMTVTLSDLRDWRNPLARSLRFDEADCCSSLPYADASFDLVTSFNAFEHMPDPARAFAEIVRVTRPGGRIHLDFGPLYASAWGLHAYRAMPMPYPQFLFSRAFIERKLDETGISDLGETRTELQYMNEWTARQYEAVWKHPDVIAVDVHTNVNADWLDVVEGYPESFRGRGLDWHDLTRGHVRAIFDRR